MLRFKSSKICVWAIASKPEWEWEIIKTGKEIGWIDRRRDRELKSLVWKNSFTAWFTVGFIFDFIQTILMYVSLMHEIGCRQNRMLNTKTNNFWCDHRILGLVGWHKFFATNPKLSASSMFWQHNIHISFLEWDVCGARHVVSLRKLHNIQPLNILFSAEQNIFLCKPICMHVYYDRLFVDFQSHSHNDCWINFPTTPSNRHQLHVRITESKMYRICVANFAMWSIERNQKLHHH